MALSKVSDKNLRSPVQRLWGTSDTEHILWASAVSGGRKSDRFLDFAVRCQLHPYLERKLLSRHMSRLQASSLLYMAVTEFQLLLA